MELYTPVTQEILLNPCQQTLIPLPDKRVRVTADTAVYSAIYSSAHLREHVEKKGLTD